MIHQNDPLWPLSLLHRFSTFFQPKTGGRLKIILLSFSARVATVVSCLAVTYWSSSSQTSSMGFKSTDCTNKDIIWRTCFAYNVPLVEFTSMVWVIILHEYKSFIYKQCSRWDHLMLRYVRFNLPNNWCKSLTLQLAKAPTTAITEPTQCFTVGVIQGVTALLSTLCQHRPSYLTKRFWTLIHQSKGLYSTACSIVQSLCALTHWSLLTLFCFLNRGFWQQFCHLGQLHRVFSSQWLLMLFFFRKIGSVVQ